MIIEFPLLFKELSIKELLVKDYINLLKISKQNKNGFIQELNALINEELDIYSLFYLMLEWRRICITDKPFPFGTKKDILPEIISEEFKENMIKIVENYPQGLIKPNFYKWTDINNNFISYISEENISQQPANILSDHLKWVNKYYNKKTNYNILIFKKIGLYPDKEYLYDIYTSILFPYELNYIHDLLSILGQNYNFDGFYWESKTIIELEYFYSIILKQSSN